MTLIKQPLFSQPHEADRHSKTYIFIWIGAFISPFPIIPHSYNFGVNLIKLDGVFVPKGGEGIGFS